MIIGGQDKFYKSNGFWWTVKYAYNVIGANVDGPFCLNCQADLEYPDSAYTKDEEGYWKLKPSWKGKLVCVNCKKSHDLKRTVEELKEEVAMQYVVMKRSEIPKQALDEPPTQVKVRDEDDKYFLAAKIGEKDGKRVGVVYFGEKNKEQNKKDYSQVFIDIDDQQARFDKTNKPPKEQLVRMNIEFADGVHAEKYRSTAGTRKAKKSPTSPNRRTG